MSVGNNLCAMIDLVTFTQPSFNLLQHPCITVMWHLLGMCLLGEVGAVDTAISDTPSLLENAFSLSQHLHMPRLLLSDSTQDGVMSQRAKNLNNFGFLIRPAFGTSLFFSTQFCHRPLQLDRVVKRVRCFHCSVRCLSLVAKIRQSTNFSCERSLL